jgi:hypothetical protein
MSLKKSKKDNKLSPKYYGSCKVLQNIGTMSYKLELSTSLRVHPIFHVSFLKKVIGDKIQIQNIFLELDKEGKLIFDLEAITNTRILYLRNRSISEYLIKWKKLYVEDSTWEDESFIQNHPLNIGTLPLNWVILHYPPLALMKTPKMMETLRHGNTHAHAPPIIISPHQCLCLFPFDINKKGHLLLGLLPVSLCLYYFSSSLMKG